MIRARSSDAEQYLDIAGAMLMAADASGTIQMANRRLCQVVGRREDELIGQPTRILVDPEDGGRDRLAELLSSDRDEVEGIERRVRSADGSLREVVWTVAIRRDADGKGIGVLCSGEDVTDRRRAEARIASEQRDLANLRRLAQAVASSEDPRQAIVDVVVDLARAGFAALVEPAADGAPTLSTTIASDPAIVGHRVELYSRVPSGARNAYLTGEPGFRAETSVHPDIVRNTQAQAVVFQPVLVEGRPAAVLAVGWADQVPAAGSREREMVGLASDEVSVALQRMAALRRLETAALTDVLTGVPNRRAFEDRLPAELARAKRTGKPLAVAMLDLNDFKALNDRDGHDAGDRLLRSVAAAWTGELRSTDVLARLGGDEFVILLPDCDAHEAPGVADRLRAVVPHAPGSGCGVVVWDATESADALMARADSALYADKARVARSRMADPARLAALAATGLLDGESSSELDHVARIGRWLLDVPIVLVSAIDAERQIFLASCGLDDAAVEAGGAPASRSVCSHVVATGRPLIIGDTRESPLLVGHPAVDEDDVAAYAGLPLTDDAGHVLGVLCAIDHQPRTWSPDDVATLRRLAARAATELRSRIAA